MSIKSFIRFIKHKFYIKWYRLRNAHPDFLATKGLSRVSKDINLGAFSYIGPGCLIYPKVSIGNYSMIANDVYIIGGDHNYKTPGVPTVFSGRDTLRSTIIGSDVWVGCRSIIMTGVKIGDGAVIAAGSVVTKDIEPFAIYGGIPAKKIGDRFIGDDLEQHLTMLALHPDKLKKLSSQLLSSKDK